MPFKTGNDLSGGPGLGLTIAKSIIESHGGKIWCVTEQGEGAEFYCALPKSEPNDGEDDLLL